MQKSKVVVVDGSRKQSVGQQMAVLKKREHWLVKLWNILNQPGTP